MSKYLRCFGVLVLFIALILVRAFAKDLFYDPFTEYFKDAYLHSDLPNYNLMDLLLNIFYRYVLNTLISIGIIYLLFQKYFLKFSLQFYSVSFVILLVLLVIILKFHLFESYLPLFYVRRFLIHPIFILLLIPVFYYQKKYA